MHDIGSGCVCTDTCKYYIYQPESAPEKCPARIHRDVLEQAKKICVTEGTDARRIWKALERPRDTVADMMAGRYVYAFHRFE